MVSHDNPTFLFSFFVLNDNLLGERASTHFTLKRENTNRMYTEWAEWYYKIQALQRKMEKELHLFQIQLPFKHLPRCGENDYYSKRFYEKT